MSRSAAIQRSVTPTKRDKCATGPGLSLAAPLLMFRWLDHNAAAVQALASIATVMITVVLAWITRKYVLLTQQLAVAAREQLRMQQHTERSDAARLLTLIVVFLGDLGRL